MRIAFVSKGTRGDVGPALAVAEALAARGHEVTACVPWAFAPEARASGLRHVGYEEPAAVFSRDEREDPGLMAAAWDRHCALALASEFDVLQSGLSSADLVVGVAATLAASSIAQALGAAYRFLGFCPQQLPSAEYPPPGAPYSASEHENTAMWKAYLECGEFAAVDLNAHRRRLGLPDIANAWDHVVDLRGLPIIAADRPLAPLPADARGIQTDAITPASRGTISPPVERFLSEGEPPVFVGFSIVSEYPGQAAAVVAGLERSGVRALVSRRLARNGLPDGCMIVGDEPHELLFPRLAAVVHHGGAGTTTTAARAGVPQLVVSHAFDHEYWGHQVERLGLGPASLRAAELDVPTFSRALAMLVGSESMKRSAAELAVGLRGRDGTLDVTDELTRHLT